MFGLSGGEIVFIILIALMFLSLIKKLNKK